MSNLLKHDIKVMLRGIKMVSKLAASHQGKSLDSAWRNSSLNPIFQKLKGDNFTPYALKDGVENMQGSSFPLQEVSERISLVFEGIRQYGRLSSSVNQEKESDDDTDDKFDLDDDILETSAEYVFKVEPNELHEVKQRIPKTAVPLKDSGLNIDETYVGKKVKDITDEIIVDKLNTSKTASDSKYFNEKKFIQYRPSLGDQAKATKVPSSRIGRLASYGSLAAGLGMGALAEVTRRAVGISEKTGSIDLASSPFLTEANAERIVRTLCRVRGAALKLGQMASMDSTFFSPQIQQLFERVRQSADFMPPWQMERVINKELGSDWRTKLKSFEEKPFAAASIGQVHMGVLHDGREVAIKVQYPGVAKGISSDISNLMSVMKMWKFLPDGLYMENIAAVAKWELAREVDYGLEAQNGVRFRKIMQPFPEFYVPEVIDELSTTQVLTTELVDGITLDKFVDAPQGIRNKVCHRILTLCLKEVFIFQFMQTDPNWSNFFYNQEKDQIMLLDFGACREFDKKFVDNYMRLIRAAVDRDEKEVMKYSIDLGFLTGYEAQVMKKAHLNATLILGSVFRHEGVYSFASQEVADHLHKIVPTMLRHRLTPPPEETYSLHRKMAGLFLLCAKLRGNVNCHELFREICNEFKFAEEN